MMQMPDEKRLATAWLVLMGLTALSVAAAHGGQSYEGKGALALFVLMASAFVKMRQVLEHFLELRKAEGGWRGFFTGMMLLLLGILLALGLVAIFLKEAP